MYFPNLNGFRFVAALAVIICHLELFKSRSGIANAWRNPFIFEAGTAGVNFFFVLSGFLITYLLLREQQEYGRISLRKFYVRRILRIWPLYYLVLLSCFFIVPSAPIFHINGYTEHFQEHFWEKLGFAFVLMPNVALYFFGEIPYAAPLWSVGVEEQFYLFWPLILVAFKNHLKAILGFIGIMLLVKAFVFVLGLTDLLTEETYMKVKNLIVATRMELMGIGALGAVLHNRRQAYLQQITSNAAAIAAMALIPVVMFSVNYLFELHHVIYALLFLVIIMNGATNEGTFIRLEKKPWYGLGTISYGLYVWHPLCIGLTLWLFKQTGLWNQSSWIANILYYVSGIGLTLLLSYLSYYYFERYFLTFKKRSTVILSGDEAKRKDYERNLNPN